VIIVDKLSMLTVKIGTVQDSVSLQELTSDSRLDFVRSRGSPTPIRSVSRSGVSVKRSDGEQEDRYSVGAFNGGGESNPQDDKGFMYVAEPGGPARRYQSFESATTRPRRTSFTPASRRGRGETQRGTHAGSLREANNESAYNLEIAWRYQRLFATGEYSTCRTSR